MTNFEHEKIKGTNYQDQHLVDTAKQEGYDFDQKVDDHQPFKESPKGDDTQTENTPEERVKSE